LPETAHPKIASHRPVGA